MKICSKCKIEKNLSLFYNTRSACKECCIEQTKIYREKNREKIREQKKRYREKNREEIREQKKRYREKNKEEIREQTKIYNEKNKEEIRERKKIYLRKKRYEDPSYRIQENLSRRIRDLIKFPEKRTSITKIIGCSRKKLREHLESLFTPGMNWDNYGMFGWHVDHIIPCKQFKLDDIEQQKICFNYKNLQPLWWEDNLSKGSKHF